MYPVKSRSRCLGVRGRSVDDLGQWSEHDVQRGTGQGRRGPERVCLGAGNGNGWDFQCCTSEGKPKPEGAWRSGAAQASVVGDTGEHQILPRAMGG